MKNLRTQKIEKFIRLSILLVSFVSLIGLNYYPLVARAQNDTEVRITDIEDDSSMLAKPSTPPSQKNITAVTTPATNQTTSVNSQTQSSAAQSSSSASQAQTNNQTTTATGNGGQTQTSNAQPSQTQIIRSGGFNVPGALIGFVLIAISYYIYRSFIYPRTILKTSEKKINFR